MRKLTVNEYNEFVKVYNENTEKLIKQLKMLNAMTYRIRRSSDWREELEVDFKALKPIDKE